ncbi:MAG: hypothetical protein NTZ74_01810 [Chloroflexi bacterium]|nr:hypothetical protein [Chloroflexota bacterium]
MIDKKLKKQYGKQYGYEVLFKGQDKNPTGKTGVILAESGLPENYEFAFYNHFMEHVFEYTLPSFLVKMILADRGTGLLDPDHPLAREEFKPKTLMDPLGSTVNKAGKPYAECAVRWIKPNKKNKWDHGYFLYKGEGANGSPDVCDKIGAKVISWYYGRLIPEKKVSWRSQLQKVSDEAVRDIRKKYPALEFRNAYYMDPDSLRKAVEDLIAAHCQTIVIQNFNCPLYTDFEDYGHTLTKVHEYVNGRARVIMADQLGNQAPMREAFIQILKDQLKTLPGEAKILVILSTHGHPFKKETQDERAALYRNPLEVGVRSALAGRQGAWDLVWSCDEYADEFWDKKHTKIETYAMYRKAIEEGYDYAIELPTEFNAENTDLMIFHAMKKFCAFPNYDRNEPIPYPDWEVPLVRKFSEGKTTGIYAGCPVGPYRKFVVQALVDSICAVMG